MGACIVVAVAENNVIGKNNNLIWHLPADLKHFKNITTGHHIIMGRKTYESIGRPLPNRTTVIVTRNANYQAEGCIVVNSLPAAFEVAQGDEQPCVVGGAEIYKQAMEQKLVDVLYFTRIHHRFDGDTFFPEVSPDQWEIASEEPHQPDEKNKYHYTFIKYVRKK